MKKFRVILRRSNGRFVKEKEVNSRYAAKELGRQVRRHLLHRDREAAMKAKQCQSWIGVDGLLLRCTKRRGHYYGKHPKHKHGEWRWWTTAELKFIRQRKR